MSKNKDKCAIGQIERKAYTRKSYVRKDGTIVSKSKVEATCIDDKGRAGKGPETLPKRKSNIHLTKYGYSVHTAPVTRHRALDTASKSVGTLLVLRKMNYYRNLQGNVAIKQIFSDDVEYMRNKYAHEKEKRAKLPREQAQAELRALEQKKERAEARADAIALAEKAALAKARTTQLRTEGSARARRARAEKKNKKQRGGDFVYYALDTNNSRNSKNFLDSDDYNLLVGQHNYASTDADTDTDTDTDADTVKIVDIARTGFSDSLKSCNSDGECIFKDDVREFHKVNGNTYVFHTPNKNEMEELREFVSASVGNNDRSIVNNKNGSIIMLHVNGKIEGYCKYRPVDNNEMQIEFFYANKGFATTLCRFFERYIKFNDYQMISVKLYAGEKNNDRLLDMFKSEGYSVISNNNEDTINLEKRI